VYAAFPNRLSMRISSSRAQLFGKGPRANLPSYHVPRRTSSTTCFPESSTRFGHKGSTRSRTTSSRARSDRGSVRDISNCSRQEIISYRKIIKPERPDPAGLTRALRRACSWPQELELYFDRTSVDRVPSGIWDIRRQLQGGSVESARGHERVRESTTARTNNPASADRRQRDPACR